MSNSEVIEYVKQSFDLKNKGYYKPAIEMLYKALAIDADNLEILAQLGQLYSLLGNFERAVYYIEKVLDIQPSHLDCLLLLEEINLKQNDIKSACGICDKICELQPNCDNLARRISLLNQLEDFEKIKELENCSCELLDDSVLYELALSYYKNNDSDKALELLQKGLEKNSKNENIMLLSGKIYYEMGEFEKAQDIFKKLEKKASSLDKKPSWFCEVLNYIGLFELSKQNFARAGEYFSNALKEDKQNAEYAYNLACAYFLNGWVDEATQFFNQAICLNHENVDYHYSLAYLYYQKKQYDKAMKELSFIKSVDLNHKLSNILNAMIVAKKGDLLSGKAQLETILKQNADDDFVHSALSEIYKELSQFESAQKSIKKALEIKPKSLNYLSSLAELELQLGNPEEVLKITNDVLEINERFLQGHLLQAKVHYEQKDFDNLFESAQNIIELDSNCAQGYYYNSVSLFEQGDVNFAIESLKKSISLDVNNALLYVKMSEFHQDLGDFENAYMWAKEANEIEDRNYKTKWLCAKLASILKKEDEALKFYSQSYRLANFDKELAQDYANYLKSVGKEKQAEKLDL